MELLGELREIVDLRFKTLKMYNRLTDIETQLISFNEKLPDVEEEVRKTFSELVELMGKVEDTAEIRLKINKLDSRAEKLEEEVFYA